MTGKKVAILQSNYIPWKGYFDLISQVDEFIFYDEVQYTKNDWRNRNKIKTGNGLHWLSIPVKHESLHQRICDIKVAKTDWASKHLKTLQQFYRKSACFAESHPFIEELYLSCNYSALSEINYHFISAINDYLGFGTKLSWSQEYGLIEGKTERLVDLVQKAGGAEYVSGPAAKSYLQEALFEDAGIRLTWMDYSGYPAYEQLYPPFEHSVSIIDLLYNVGSLTVNCMDRTVNTSC